jgi:hypothetical protein
MDRPQITPALVIALVGAVARRAVAVWFYLWSRADRNTAKAWPSVRTIAEDLEMKSGHVSEDVRALESEGWLRVDRIQGNKSSYTVIAPREAYPETGAPPPHSVSQNRNGLRPKTGAAS